jgi:hypothetical protein
LPPCSYKRASYATLELDHTLLDERTRTVVAAMILLHVCFYTGGR